MKEFLESRKVPSQLSGGSQELRKAVEVDGSRLQFVPNSQQDRDIVHLAVRQHGAALQFAQRRYREYHVIAICAVRSCEDAFRYAAEELQQDDDIRKVVGLPSIRQSDDRDSMLKAVARHTWATEFASDALKADR